MPRYPMLLSGILRYTDTAENQENEEMMREKELLERAKDSVQVTVSEINKRVREEDLNGLLNDIKTHLSIHDFLKGSFLSLYFVLNRSSGHNRLIIGALQRCTKSPRDGKSHSLWNGKSQRNDEWSVNRCNFFTMR